MTAAAAPLAEPAETAFPPCGEGEEWARPMLQRELEVLGELAELGLKMARTIVAQANGEATAEPVIQGDLPLAFSRVSRAARMAVLLQARLIQEIKDGGRKRAAEDEDEGPVQWEVEWVDEDPPWVAREAARDEAEAGESRETERMESERPERLERDDIYADLMTLSKEELVARIRRDLGVGADQCATSPVYGGGGPLKGVEGALTGRDVATDQLTPPCTGPPSPPLRGPPLPQAGEVASP
jgi:hypothetical protein